MWVPSVAATPATAASPRQPVSSRLAAAPYSFDATTQYQYRWPGTVAVSLYTNVAALFVAIATASLKVLSFVFR